jgi:hypothetical protein
MFVTGTASEANLGVDLFLDIVFFPTSALTNPNS